MILVGLAVVVLGQRGCAPLGAVGSTVRRDRMQIGWRTSAPTRRPAAASPGGRVAAAGRYWPPRRAGWGALTVWMARSNLAGK